MKTFKLLNNLRVFQRAHMPYLQTLEDYDIVCEVGTAQEAGRPFFAKHLVEDRLGAPATITRRLNRLVKLGIVTRVRDYEDGRMASLRLPADVLKAYGKLAKVIAQRENN